MKKLFLFILVLYPAVALSQGKTWITEKTLPGGVVLHLHWAYEYEGFESVFKVEAEKGGKVINTFDIYGQPVFNEENTLVAFPACWDGGCELEIRVLDLKQLKELKPIKLEREAFLECSWEGARLRVLLGAMNAAQTDEVRYFEMVGRPSI